MDIRAQAAWPLAGLRTEKRELGGEDEFLFDMLREETPKADDYISHADVAGA